MEKENSNHVWSILVTILAYTSILFLWNDPLTLTLLLSAILIMLLALRRSWTDVFVALIIVILSALFEVTSVYLGIWQHMSPGYLGVPLWIPIGWALFAIFVRSLYRLFTGMRSAHITSI
ncbi:hypothetical protein L0Y40_00810 [Candidatus Wolfebacteria bacterium]|nr:hypothetical protein [Candidatus Wolfebacteria bacterium]